MEEYAEPRDPWGDPEDAPERHCARCGGPLVKETLQGADPLRAVTWRPGTSEHAQTTPLIVDWCPARGCNVVYPHHLDAA